NDFNAGGGGGAGGGRGGFGGKQYIGSGDNPATQGLGGAVPSGSLLLVAGGGGGGGQRNAGGTTEVGGAGGGIVLLIAQRLAGTGTIASDGAPGGNSGSDG